MDIFVKAKDTTIGRLVSETILALRRFLITQKIEELAQKIKDSPEVDSKEMLEDVRDYFKLKNLLSNKLNRVM